MLLRMANAFIHEREMPATAIRTLVVDDEPLSRRLLCTLLKSLDGVDVVAEAGGMDEVCQKLAELWSDLVFMDI